MIICLTNCQTKQKSILGFWEGPHPVENDKKFYFQISIENNTLRGKAFWTENNFYISEFEIDSITLFKDTINIFVPEWNCYYKGFLIDNNTIKGGFNCENEPFDSIQLFRNDDISKYLTEPIANCFSKNFHYQYQIPEQIDDKIETSKYYSENDSLFIYNIINEIINCNYGRLNSFLLFKNNKLICEEYFFGYTKNDLHQIESSTKSITSLLIGIAFDNEFVESINQPIYEIFENYPHLSKGEYKKITIENLLTMTSSYEVNDELFLQSENRIDYALKRKIINNVGEVFVYDGANTQILGAILKEKTNLFADEFAKIYLFEPLGITKYNWEIFKQNNEPLMGGSLELLPRDLGKIGLLVINNGMFDNQQIISNEWINKSTSEKVKTHIENDNYSYHWWNITLNSNNKKYEVVWANGWGSQFIYIIPELDVVIVTTGYNYENDSWKITSGIEKYIYLLE